MAVALFVAVGIVWLHRRGQKQEAAAAAAKEAGSDAGAPIHANEKTSVIDFALLAPGILPRIQEESHCSTFDEKEMVVAVEQHRAVSSTDQVVSVNRNDSKTKSPAAAPTYSKGQRK